MLTAPLAFAEIQQAESGQVPGRYTEGVGGKTSIHVIAVAAAEVRAVFYREIFHVQRICNAPFEFFKELGSGFLFENCPQYIEIPIIVVEKRSRQVATARRIIKRSAKVQSRKIDARSAFKQMSDCGLFFESCKRFVIINPQLF